MLVKNLLLTFFVLMFWVLAVCDGDQRPYFIIYFTNSNNSYRTSFFSFTSCLNFIYLLFLHRVLSALQFFVLLKNSQIQNYVVCSLVGCPTVDCIMIVSCWQPTIGKLTFSFSLFILVSSTDTSLIKASSHFICQSVPVM